MIAEQLGLKKPLIFEIPNILNETECDQTRAHLLWL